MAELDRLSGWSKIMWYPQETLPAQLIVQPGKVRMVLHWSNPKYGLNGMPVNSEMGYGTIDGFPFPLRPWGLFGGTWPSRLFPASVGTFFC